MDEVSMRLLEEKKSPQNRWIGYTGKLASSCTVGVCRRSSRIEVTRGKDGRMEGYEESGECRSVSYKKKGGREMLLLSNELYNRFCSIM